MDIPGRLFDNRKAPLTEQYGLFFDRELPAVAYLQPAKGPAITIVSLIKAGAGAIGVTLPPGTYALIVSTTGTL